MSTETFEIGDMVKTLRDFCGIPCGSIGKVVEDYGSGIMIEWRDFEFGDKPLCDGFNKEFELQFLEKI